MAEEVVDDYRSSLEDLKMNSKPLINMLTMLAEENKQYAAQFVEVIEDRVLKASPSEKLPAMYLIDSIIKNLTDSNYLQLFSKNLVTTFLAVFEKVDEKTRSALFKLRLTWNDLFPMNTLYLLDIGVREIDPAWPLLPGAKIHVNPKFLSKAEEERETTPAVAVAETPQVAEEEPVQEEVEEQKLDQENRDSYCMQLENDILLKQQLMAKQEEILKLHQQRLELELSKAKAEIEQRARELKKKEEALKAVQTKETTHPSKATAKPATPPAAKTLPVPPNRDPRIRPSGDPRVTQASALSHNTAVVLPTPSPKTTENVVLQTSSAALQSSSKTTASSAAGNIFDRLQDLTVKSENGSPAKPSATETKKLSGAGSKESVQSSKGQKSSTEKKPEKSQPQSGKKDVNKDVRTASKTSSPDKKSGKDGNKKPEGKRNNQKSSSPRSKSPPDDKSNKDSYGHGNQKRPAKSARTRSPGSSEMPPGKFAKCNEQSQPGVNFKPTAARRTRRNSNRDGGMPSRVRAQGNEREQETGVKRPFEHDAVDASPRGAKKVKPLIEAAVNDTRQLSDDLMELFGNTDTDYRCMPPSGPHSKPPSLLAPPPRRRDSLLLSPSVPTSQASGWAQFKASRPEDFPFQQSHSHTSHDSFDADIRSALQSSPGLKPSIVRRAPLLPTPGISGNTERVTMDTIERQMNDLRRLQDMKKSLDKQREHLLGSFPSFPAPAVTRPTGVEPVDSQFSELHRLQNLKRDLDEKQERLQSMIDSGMKISDEFNSAFANFNENVQNEGFHPPVMFNKRLDIHDESSKSPVYKENSPRLNADMGYYPEERGGLLGNRPLLPEPRLQRRDDTAALLPTPFSDRDIGKGVSSAPPHRSAPREMPPHEDEQFYYPERDPRWAMREQMQGSRPSNVYNVVIDGKHYEMAFSNRPLKIWLNRQEKVIRLDPNTRQLWCNDVAIYHLGEDEKSVILDGKQHLVYVQGPSKKIWIDNHLFDINIDSPAEKINIGGKEHNISIDGGKNRIIVDGFDVCPFGTDDPQLVKLAFVMHTIQFHPPCKQILIDGNLCNLDLAGRFPIIVIEGKARGIRFDGDPQIVFIDNKPWTVPVDGARRCHLDGPSSKPVVLALGGPGHEVIVDDQWYELKFGGIEKYIKVGRKMRKFQLRGNPPDVKILGEVVINQENGPDRPMMNQPGSRPMLPGFGPQSNRRGTPDTGHRHDAGAMSSDNIPRLLDINIAPKMERARSYGQLPVPRQQDGFRHPAPSDQHLQGPGPHGPGPQGPGPHGPGPQGPGPHGPGPHGPRPMDEPYGPGPYERDGMIHGPQFGGPNHRPMDPRLRIPQHGKYDQMGMHNQMDHHTHGVPYTPPGLQHGGPMPQMNQPGLRFGPPGMGAPPAGQVYNQHPYGEVEPPPQQTWNAADNFMMPSGNVQESIPAATATTQQPAVDINSLLTQLLAAGLIKKTPEVDHSNASTPPVDQQQIKLEEEKAATSNSVASEEQKEEARKEEESVEDIPDLTDFNLDNLKKAYAGATQRVYLGVQCQTCGVRFTSSNMDRYNEHLDWHFRKNRKEKEEMRVAKFRHWYYDIIDWIQFEEVSCADDRVQPENLSEPLTPSKTNKVLESQASNIISCPRASGNDKEDICDTCRESLEQFWDEEREAWHLKDAILVDGKTYHPICYEDVKDVSLTEVVADEAETNSVEKPSVADTRVSETPMEGLSAEVTLADEETHLSKDKESVPLAQEPDQPDESRIEVTTETTEMKTEPMEAEEAQPDATRSSDSENQSSVCVQPPQLENESETETDSKNNKSDENESETLPDVNEKVLSETVASPCTVKNESNS